MPTAEALELDGVLLVRPRRHADQRGYFVETWRADACAALGIDAVFVQENESLSYAPGTVRGLHFQLPPAAQAKLVRVVRGAIFDVAVDLRSRSPTRGRWCGARLSAEGAEQLFIPRGFAHGFCTLEPDTVVVYKVDSFYAPECEGGLAWNDPDIGIAWPVAPAAATVSERDRRLPPLARIDMPF